MPLGAAQASVEDRMRSEPSKRSGENLYSTGFWNPANYHDAESGCFLVLSNPTDPLTQCSAFSRRISNSRAKLRRGFVCNPPPYRTTARTRGIKAFKRAPQRPTELIFLCISRKKY